MKHCNISDHKMIKFKFSRWKWETAKMVLYVFFPITMFYYFSNPAVYEKELVENYQTYHAPPDEDDLKQMKALKEKIRKEKIEEMRSKLQQDLSKNA